MADTLSIYKFDPKYAADEDGFTFNLSAWLGDDDEILGTPTVTLSPTGATVTAVVTANGMVTAWVSGGTLGRIYTIELRVVTVDGRDCHIRGQFKIIT